MKACACVLFRFEADAKRSGPSGERKPWHEQKTSGKSNIAKHIWPKHLAAKEDGNYLVRISEKGKKWEVMFRANN